MNVTCLKSVHIKNFRCFTTLDLELNHELILIQGSNGCGKTSILEALHYGTYLRSFRTRIPKELVKFGSDHFFIKIMTNSHEMLIGVTGSKKQIKINQKSITSYEDLRDFQTMVSVTEDDLAIIKGSPEERRLFLDATLLLLNRRLSNLFKDYRTILSNRNALLQKTFVSLDELTIWTEKLWSVSHVIQSQRIEILEKLSIEGKHFIKEHFGTEYHIDYEYHPKHVLKDLSWQEFYVFWKSTLLEQEKIQKRTLFGAHTDDVLIFFNNRLARFYASRGQQKLLLMLIKMAQINLLRTNSLFQNSGITFLIDDFMTDFDENIMEKIITTGKSLSIQLIFTSPAKKSVDEVLLVGYGAQLIRIAD